MSKQEIGVRSKQQLRKLGERLLGHGAGGLSDADFLGMVEAGSRNCSALGTAASIVERIRNRMTFGETLLFPGLGRRQEICEVIDKRFPRERRSLIDRADRAMAGRFDLLGLTDLSFGYPIDWRLEPLSGKRTPLDHWSKINYLNPDIAGDKKVTWELNRHQHFVTLGQAYWLTGDERYSAEFVAQASSWIEANPPGLGINWASSLEVALRSIAWIWALHLFIESPNLTPAFMLSLLKSLCVHAYHIENYTSHYFSPNTHLTGEALGLFYIGSALPELTRAESWRSMGTRILTEQLPRQVRADGVYFEQSSYYHRYTADFYTHLFLIAQTQERLLPEEVEADLERMLEHLMWITEPDGDATLLGDDDGGKLLILSDRKLDDFRDTLATGAVLFDRGDWKYVAGEAAVETLWLLGPDGLLRFDQLDANPPDEYSRAFDDSGFYVVRDGWSPESSYLAITSGPEAADRSAHAHSDALSLSFSALGKKWLVDPGTFTYTANMSERDQFRLSSAHNTVTVDGYPQSVPEGPFSWGHIAQATTLNFITESCFDYFEGEHNGYERLSDPVTHNRAILFVRPSQEWTGIDAQLSYLVIRDSFAARSLHQYEIRFHFPPDCTAVANGERVLVSEPDGAKLSITAFGRGSVRTQIEKGWVSRAYGRREPALVAVLRSEGHGPQEFVTLVIPSSNSSTIQVRQRSAGPSSRSFDIQADNVRDALLIGDGHSRTSGGPLTGCARIAWARFADENVVSGGMVGGRLLEARGGLVLRFASPVGVCAFRRIDNAFDLVIDGNKGFSLLPNESAADFIMNNGGFSARNVARAQSQHPKISKIR